MDKKKTIRWLLIAAGLLALALVLHFFVPKAGPLPYLFGAAALVIVLDLFRKNWAALAGILTAGGLILKSVGHGYDYWGYLAFFLAALIVAHRFLGKTLWRILMGLVCVGFAYFCFVEFFVIRDARTDAEPKRDYLIVLGAAVYGDQPSLTLERRLEGALEYLEAFPESTVIVSGGMGAGETITEARAMRDWLIDKGVEPDRILMEDRATSTMENLSFSFEIIRSRGDDPDGNVAVCSSAYHLYRAKQMAKGLGVEAAGVAAPWGYFFVMLNYFIREAFGVTHLWIFGY